MFLLIIILLTVSYVLFITLFTYSACISPTYLTENSNSIEFPSIHMFRSTLIMQLADRCLWIIALLQIAFIVLGFSR